MCLISSYSQPIITKQDIVTWKLLTKINDHFFSVSQAFLYELEKLYTIDQFGIQQMPKSDKFKINKGFHSWNWPVSAINYRNSYSIKLTEHYYHIAQCLIPAGSECITSCDDFEYLRDKRYFIESTIVSNQIIIQKIINR